MELEMSITGRGEEYWKNKFIESTLEQMKLKETLGSRERQVTHTL